MSTLAPLLQAFFTERLICQRDASPHTVASYRDAICLLLRFAHQRTGKPPHQLGLDDLDAPLIGAFLHADLSLKEKALARTTPPDTPTGRYRPPDSLLEFLESL